MVDRRITGDDVTLQDVVHGYYVGMEGPVVEAGNGHEDDDNDDDDDAVGMGRGFVADDVRFLLHKEGVQERGPNGWAKATRKGEFAIFEARIGDPYVDLKTGKLKGNVAAVSDRIKPLTPEEEAELDAELGIVDDIKGKANAAVDSGIEQTQVPYFTVKTGEFKGERVTLYFFRNLGGQMVIEFDGGRVDRGKLLGGTIRMEFTEGRLRGRGVFVAPKDLEPAGEFAARELDNHLRAVIREKSKLKKQKEAAEARAKAKTEAGQNAEKGLKRGGDRKSAKYVQKKKPPRVY